MRSWGLTRLVSRPYPPRESCQIPHSAAAHLGTLQGVTARWVIAVLPIIGSRLSVVQPQSGHWAASSGPFQAVGWAVRGVVPLKLGSLTVGSTP